MSVTYVVLLSFFPGTAAALRATEGVVGGGGGERGCGGGLRQHLRSAQVQIHLDKLTILQKEKNTKKKEKK